jgi:hypothetical protein
MIHLNSFELACNVHSTDGNVGTPTLAPRIRRRVVTLEREATQNIEVARAAGVSIDFLGFAPLFQEPRSYVGDGTDWVLMPARPNDTDYIPKAQAQALIKLDKAGLLFPVLYVGHEVPKGRLPVPSSTTPGSSLVVSPIEAASAVGEVPPPVATVDLAQRLNDRAKQVFGLMAKAVPVLGIVVAAPFVLAAGAVASLATLDPVIFGAIPAGSLAPGEPAAWYVLVRWAW